MFESSNNKSITSITAVIGISVHLVRSEPTKILNATHYSVGTIDTTTGENVDSNLSFRMKNLQTTDGIVIDIKDNPSVTYDIYFYNEDEELVGYQLDLEVDFDSESLMPGYKKLNMPKYLKDKYDKNNRK